MSDAAPARFRRPSWRDASLRVWWGSMRRPGSSPGRRKSSAIRAEVSCPATRRTCRSARPPSTFVVSGLVLNFIPDRLKALGEMKRAAAPGGRVCFYVWDYPGGGVEFMRAFWDAATALDPGAADLSEARRFPFCEPSALMGLAQAAGLVSVACEAIEAPTVFRNFDDYWRPFTLGAGPAPGYCASLAPEKRERLRELLRERLPVGEGGSITLNVRAWAVTGAAA